MCKTLMAWVTILSAPALLYGDEHEPYELFAKVESRFPLESSINSLHVDMRVGDVEVVRAEGSEARVEAVVRVNRHDTDISGMGKEFEQHVKVTREKGTLAIVDAHKDAADRKAWAVSVRVALPRPLPVAAQTGVGDVDVSVATGIVSLGTGVGDVTLEAEQAASLSAQSGVGDLKLQVGHVEGQAIANTGTGDVTLAFKQLGGPLEAESGTGEVSVRIADSSSQNDVSLVSGVGRLVLELPADANGHFDLKTSTGSISVKPAAALNVHRARVGSSASGQIGTGGPTYALRTGVGAIALKFR